ncbi:MAG: glycosyltransferase family 61 protein [Ilumatobacteraceae bacterium]
MSSAAPTPTDRVPGPAVLRMRVVEDAVLVPRATFGDVSLGAGVLRPGKAGLRPLQGAGVRRRGREYVLPPPTDVRPAARVESAVFGGFVYDHFGHFLLESLGRLWFDGVDPDVPVVWIAATGREWRPWMTELADLVGVGPHRRILDAEDDALEVGSLLVGDQGFEVHRYMHPWFRDRLAVAAVAERDPGTGTHVWLSRSGLGEIGGVDEESAIESRLEEEGWTVVHPERMTVAEQIAVLSMADHVAGIEGSAFHVLLLLSGFRGTIDILTRHDSPNFEVINRVQKLDLRRHALVGGEPRVWNRPNGSRDVGWTGVDVDATVRLVSSTCARHVD